VSVRETFFGSGCMSDPKKVSDPRTDRDRLLAARGSVAGTAPKGRPRQIGLGALERPHFGALRASLPRPEQEGVGSPNSSPFEPMGDTPTTPFSSPKWLKSSALNLSEKGLE
jgi:hypothetical protein